MQNDIVKQPKQNQSNEPNPAIDSSVRSITEAPQESSVSNDADSSSEQPQVPENTEQAPVIQPPDHASSVKTSSGVVPIIVVAVVVCAILVGVAVYSQM